MTRIEHTHSHTHTRFCQIAGRTSERHVGVRVFVGRGTNQTRTRRIKKKTRVILILEKISKNSEKFRKIQ